MLVVGDVTSTMACAIAAQKLRVPVAHVEGGIRSGDWSMPEEINRLVTDAITNWFFTTSEVANANLRQAGVAEERIFFVGNTMIDTLLANQAKFRGAGLLGRRRAAAGPVLRDDAAPAGQRRRHPGFRAAAARGRARRCAMLPVVFPVHPRTAKTLAALPDKPACLLLVDPQPYLEFNYLVRHARGVITDSGGVTEETTVMGVPCVTLARHHRAPRDRDHRHQ